MLTNILLGLSVLLIGFVANVATLAIMATWGGVFGAVVMLVFSIVGFYSCRIISNLGPGLWLLWSLLFGAVAVGGLVDTFFGAAISWRELAAVFVVSAAGFFGSYTGRAEETN